MVELRWLQAFNLHLVKSYQISLNAANPQLLNIIPSLERKRYSLHSRFILEDRYDVLSLFCEVEFDVKHLKHIWSGLISDTGREVGLSRFT